MIPASSPSRNGPPSAKPRRRPADDHSAQGGHPRRPRGVPRPALAVLALSDELSSSGRRSYSRCRRIHRQRPSQDQTWSRRTANKLHSTVRRSGRRFTNCDPNPPPCASPTTTSGPKPPSASGSPIASRDSSCLSCEFPRLQCPCKCANHPRWPGARAGLNCRSRFRQRTWHRLWLTNSLANCSPPFATRWLRRRIESIFDPCEQCLFSRCARLSAQESPARQTHPISTAKSHRCSPAAASIATAARSRRAGSICSSTKGLPRAARAARRLSSPASRTTACCGNAIDADEMPPKHPLPAGENGDPQGVDRRRRALGHRPDRSLSLSPPRPRRLRLVVAAAAGSPGGARIRNPQSAIRNPIDAFVLAKLEANGLAASPPADRRTLIRRRYLRPDRPAADARRGSSSFVNDESADAYAKAVDRLLASPHYGERWARHWLDVARFGESDGFEYDRMRPHAWPYRDWVIDALNRDLPYDEFARLQIAGDVLRPGDDDRRSSPPASSSPGSHDGLHAQGRRDAADHAAGRAGRHRRPRRPDVSRPDGQLRPLPRSQVRSDPPDRLLPPRRRHSPACNAAIATSRAAAAG